MAGEARRTKYDGVNVYLPRIDLIESGDILLTFNAESENRRESKQSKLIRKMTRGNFSHALICSTPPTFVEAIGTGVSTLSLGRCFAHDIANVRLLRYPDQDIARKAAQLAQDEIGRDYSVARAVRSVFPLELLDRIDDHGTFCSALVAQVYSLAGSDIFKVISADRTTPATIEKLSGLSDLTGAAFRSALSPNSIEQMSALDGDRAPTASARQTAFSAECARQTWPRAANIAKSYPEIGLNPTVSFYGLLRFLTDALDRMPLLSPSRRFSLAIELKLLDDELFDFIAQGHFEKLLSDIAQIDDNAIERTIRESFRSNPDIDLESLASYSIAGQKQLAERLAGITNWELWDPTRSRALTAYLRIDRAAAKAVERRNIALKEVLERLGVSISPNSSFERDREEKS